MKSIYKKKRISKTIMAREFDRKFNQGRDISAHLDFKRAAVVKRVNVDFPGWMVTILDGEALKLNVSRQAVIKMWIRDRIDPSHHVSL